MYPATEQPELTSAEERRRRLAIRAEERRPRIARREVLLLTPEEAADILGVSPATLAKWRCRKSQPLPYKKVGRLVRYFLADVEAFARGQLDRAMA